MRRAPPPSAEPPACEPSRHAPDRAYRESLRVRSYETARDGTVRPATLLRYLEHIATRASAAAGFDHVWYEARHAAWVVRGMDLLLAAPAHMDDELELATWVSAYRRVQAFREYAAWRRDTGRLVARARARWAYINSDTGQPLRVPEAVTSQIEVLERAMHPRPLALPPNPPPLAERETTVTARDYEADTQQHVNNAVYLDWLGEALRPALPPDGASTLRPRRFAIDYARAALPDQRLRLCTRLVSPHRRLLLAEQEISDARDGAIVTRARSAYLLV